MEAQAAPVAPSLRARIVGLRQSETAPAAGLAIATIVQQLMAVVFTVLFARILGTDGYGSLAALINFTVLLVVPGSALQVVTARQGTLGRFGHGPELAATLARWTRHILYGLGAVAVVSFLLRRPLADLVNIDQEWAAAAVPVRAALWLLVCVQRGLLQAARAYRPVAISIVAEGLVRLLGSLALVALALGVTGAYLGQFVAWAGVAIVLHRILRRRLGPPALGRANHPLSALARHAAVPIAGLVLVAALQNVDVIMARHALDHDTAGIYAATTVAAKAIVWVAVGIGLWVLPEATRRAAAGLDPRHVLVRALALIGLLTVPALAIFALFPRLLLKTAFGADFASGDRVLLVLGIAFALLACTYVVVQFLLGLHRRLFVLVLLAVAVAEPLVLASATTLESFAARVLILQAVAAAAIVVLGALVRRDPLAGSEPVL